MAPTLSMTNALPPSQTKIKLKRKKAYPGGRPNTPLHSTQPLNIVQPSFKVSFTLDRVALTVRKKMFFYVDRRKKQYFFLVDNQIKILLYFIFVQVSAAKHKKDYT